MGRDDEYFFLFPARFAWSHPHVLDCFDIRKNLCARNAHRLKPGCADIQRILRIRLALIRRIKAPLLRRSIQLQHLRLTGAVR